jgi:hypothetical protein
VKEVKGSFLFKIAFLASLSDNLDPLQAIKMLIIPNDAKITNADLLLVTILYILYVYKDESGYLSPDRKII